jgi:hypothetical protein
VSKEVECRLCRRPVRSAAAKERQVGAGCWRKLTPAQRAAIRRSPAAARTALTQPVPDVDGQLPLEEQEPGQ